MNNLVRKNISSKLKNSASAIGYYSYTNRWASLKKRMKIKILGISLFAFFMLSFNIDQPLTNAIEIQWLTELAEDFSFINKWDYQEGIYKDRFGQLSCDGFCPERTWSMKDENGKILKDSLEIFYQLIDTTHIYHSIKSKVNMYEYSETNFIEVQRINKDTIRCFTINNASTHSSLSIEIVNNNCFAKVDFNSIRGIDRHTFHCKNGIIIIDKDEWKKGILKAKFDFSFENDLDENIPLNWKGLIYKRIITN